VRYRGSVDLSGATEPAAVFEELFQANGWEGTWRDPVAFRRRTMARDGGTLAAQRAWNVGAVQALERFTSRVVCAISARIPVRVGLNHYFN
jgi:hypothetical protein